MEKVSMRNLYFLIVFLAGAALITVMSNSSNELSNEKDYNYEIKKGDGVRVYNGSQFRMIGGATNNGTDIIKLSLVNRFGWPTRSISTKSDWDNMEWNFDSLGVVSASPVKLVVHMDSTFRMQDNKKVFDKVIFDLCLMDSNNNDMLLDSRKKDTLFELINDVLM